MPAIPDPSTLNSRSARLRGRFLEHGVASALPSLRSISDDAAIRRAVDESLELSLAQIASHRSRTSPGVIGFEAPCLVEWAPDRAMIVRPMAEAESRPCPHALVLHRTDNPRSADELGAMLDAVCGALQPLAVDRLALFVHGPVPTAGPLAPGAHGRIQVDPYKRYPAASIERLLASSEASKLRQSAARQAIVAQCPTDLSFHPEYERMYEAFWREHPELGAQIGIESRDALELYTAQDGLRLIRIDGELAGVFAALREPEHGLRGWRMRERILGEQYRGEGLGAATLLCFVESLVHERDDLVWGTILPDNIGSLRSATRLGRTDVGGLLWVTEG